MKGSVDKELIKVVSCEVNKKENEKSKIKGCTRSIGRPQKKLYISKGKRNNDLIEEILETECLEDDILNIDVHNDAELKLNSDLHPLDEFTDCTEYNPDEIVEETVCSEEILDTLGNYTDLNNNLDTVLDSVGNDLDSDFDNDLDSDFDSDLDSDFDNDLDSDFDSDLDSDFDSDLDSDFDSDLNSNSASDLNSDSASELDSNYDSDLNSDSVNELANNYDSDLNSDSVSELNNNYDSDLNSDSASDFENNSENSLIISLDTSFSKDLCDDTNSSECLIGHIVKKDSTCLKKDDSLDLKMDIKEDNKNKEIDDEESKFKYCVYYKGMSVSEFLSKNKEYRESFYVEHFYSQEELQKLLKRGEIFLKKGKYKH